MARSCHRSVDPASSDAVPLLCDLARRRWSLTRLSIRPSVASVPSVNRPALGEALMSLERALLGKILRITGPMLVLLFLLPTCILPANAVPLYTTGFENPPFTLGNLAGQDGWAISATGPSVATTLVENTVVESGGQAVSVGGSVTDQTGPFHSNASTGPLIDLAADIRLKSSTTQNAWQFAGLGPSLTQFLGGIDILANGNVEVITAGFPWPLWTALSSRPTYTSAVQTPGALERLSASSAPVFSTPLATPPARATTQDILTTSPWRTLASSRSPPRSSSGVLR